MTTTDSGNTKTSSVRVQSRKWVFTVNNWTEEELTTILQKFSEKKWEYGIGKEKGESGTPHLQGWLQSKSPIEIKVLKKIMPRAHIEKMKGKVEDSIIYCSKDGDYESNRVSKTETPENLYNQEMEEEYKDVKWLPWQKAIIDKIEEKPDKRKVYWYWEENGNIGKTFLAKYLDWKYDAIIANGKQGDVFHAYAQYLEKNQPKVSIIDIPRSHKEYVCYSTMEKIKDGLVHSGKYEGKKLRICRHHLIIFANFPPDKRQLSEDRWEIVNING